MTIAISVFIATWVGYFIGRRSISSFNNSISGADNFHNNYIERLDQEFRNGWDQAWAECIEVCHKHYSIEYRKITLAKMYEMLDEIDECQDFDQLSDTLRIIEQDLTREERQIEADEILQKL